MVLPRRVFHVMILSTGDIFMVPAGTHKTHPEFVSTHYGYIIIFQMYVFLNICIEKMRGMLLLILIAGLMLFGFSCNGPEPASIEYDEIDLSQDPVQHQYNPNDVIRIETEDGAYNLQFMSTYKVSALVVGRKTYSSGWEGQIAPIDLALVWGKPAEPDYDKYVSYRQSDRWYFFEIKPDSPFSPAFISRHSSNNHIIPATNNVLKALKSIKKNQKIVLEGFLINIDGVYKGHHVWWASSLSRTDTGDNSCELMYVQRVRVEDYVYE